MDQVKGTSDSHLIHRTNYTVLYHPQEFRPTLLKPLTSKVKGTQALFLAVEGTVDRQRVLASTQGLSLI